MRVASPGLPYCARNDAVEVNAERDKGRVERHARRVVSVENQGGSDQVTPANKTSRWGPDLDHPSDVDLSPGAPI